MGLVVACKQEPTAPAVGYVVSSLAGLMLDVVIKMESNWCIENAQLVDSK